MLRCCAYFLSGAAYIGSAEVQLIALVQIVPIDKTRYA
jgi:hypothetical protein